MSGGLRIFLIQSTNIETGHMCPGKTRVKMGPQINAYLANPLIALVVRSLIPPHKTTRDWRGTLGCLCVWVCTTTRATKRKEKKYTHEGIKFKKMV